MSDYDLSIHQNPDAKVWARFFIQTMEEKSWSLDDIDEEFMIGWFANAMMAMHDHIYTKQLLEHDAQVIETWLKRLPISNRAIRVSDVRKSAQNYANQLRQKAQESFNDSE